MNLKPRPFPVVALAGSLALAAGLIGCQSVPDAHPVSLTSPDSQRVTNALGQWPHPSPGVAIKRPFFITIHAAGQRTSASGILEYYGPRDFRITAATELGVILLDARMNWAGVTVLRSMPGLDRRIIEALIDDMSHAFDVPSKLDGLKVGEEKMILQKRRSDTRDYTWIFDRTSGRLLQTDVAISSLDTLRIYYKSYNPVGWPLEMQIVRPVHLYDVSLSFTDNNVVRGADENPPAE